MFGLKNDFKFSIYGKLKRTTSWTKLKLLHFVVDKKLFQILKVWK